MGEAVRATSELIRPGRVLLIGELHGTYEFPALVAGIAASAATKGLGILVGLEIPRSEQGRIDRFLGSDGSPDAIASMTESPFWHRPKEWDDGRSSIAMLNLLCTLRALGVGRHVSVCAFDLPWGAPGEALPTDLAALFAVPRDQAMADQLRGATELDRNVMTIVLAGNEHTRLWSRRHDANRPLGERLNEACGDVVTLIGHNLGGTIRAATTRRGAEDLSVYADSTPIGLGWFSNTRADGHHGWVNVGVVNAAPPLPPA